MHIDNDKLVGTYVSDRYSEKGTVTIVLTDGDSTPTREYTRYKYVQTEQLTAIGVAVKDYGAILVPETTIALFESGVLNAADFGIFVKFNGEYYNVGLSTLLATEIGAAVTFNAGGLDSYAPTTFNATLPPYSVGNAGQVPTVDENGKVGWDDIPEELPSVTGNTGKFLGVNDNGTGVQWKDIPKENFIYDMKYFDNDGWYLCYKDTIDKATDVVTGKDVRWTNQGVNKVYQMVKYEGTQESGYINLATLDNAKWYVRKIDRQNDGTYKWDNNETEYPQVPAIASGDAGKVLKVNNSENGVEWGAAGGGKLYQHLISLRFGSGTSIVTVNFEIITNKSTGYTVAELGEYLYNKGVRSDTTGIPVRYLTARGGDTYWYPDLYAKYSQYVTPNYYLSLTQFKFSVDASTGDITREMLSEESNPTLNHETVYEI